MLYELPAENYDRVAALFAVHRRHHMLCAGVLAGTVNGQVLVDDLTAPKSALVFKEGGWCYGAGAPIAEAFATALRRELSERRILPERLGALLVSGYDAAWQPLLAGLLPERRPIPVPRRLYVATSLPPEPATPLPLGCTLHFVDDSLPAQLVTDLPPDVSTVLKLRAGQDRPDQTALGYVIVQERRCVAHAVIDCIVADRGEIGLFTTPAWRQQGLGQLAAAATLRYGLQNGLRQIHWDCRASNVGSVRLAERLGLRLERAYEQQILIFNEAGYLVNWGFAELDKGHYQATLAYCEQMLAGPADIRQPYAHYLAGAAEAGLGNIEAAIVQLQAAGTAGFDELAELTARDTLQPLKQRPEWSQIVAKVRQNRDEGS